MSEIPEIPEMSIEELGALLRLNTVANPETADGDDDGDDHDDGDGDGNGDKGGGDGDHDTRSSTLDR